LSSLFDVLLRGSYLVPRAALGSVKFRGIGLGTAGVLFAGILIGHFGETVDHHTLDFVKEFGLILFVFTIGLQLGPGFFAALRPQGGRMNALAAVIVILGAVSAPLIGWLAGFDAAAVLGIFSGASTNTPSLGGGTQTLSTLPDIARERLTLPALAYAVTYPTAIVGIIGTLLLLKQIFRIDPVREAADFVAKNRRQVEPLERCTLVVTNPNLEGIRLDAIPGRLESGVTISRVRHDDETHVATDATVIHRDDRLAVVGLRAGLDQFARVIGRHSDEDLVLAESALTFRRVVVTDREVLGKTVGELDLDDRFGVAVTRVTRADLEMSAMPDLRLQFGDQAQIVGVPDNLDKAAAVVGNSHKELNETHFIPFFLGITLGVALGTLPIAFPGLPQPIKLGLAGGPLIVALILGRVGRIGRQVWHMPVNTNLAFREFGIALFFAAVGLGAGRKILRHRLQRHRPAMAARRRVCHGAPAHAHRPICASRLEDELHGSQRPAGRQHDRPARPRLCLEHRRLRRPYRRLRHRLSADHPPAHPLRASARDRPLPMNTHTLGEPRFASTLSHTISDDVRIPERIEIGAEPGIRFELAGPRAKLFFDPKQTRAGIVTCGGLCPGLNNVIRSLFLEPHYSYGIVEVQGFRGGYSGLDPERGNEPVKITPLFVDGIHQKGGTILGSSRGPVDMGKAVENLIARGVNILFTVGGDGAQRGANDLYQEALMKVSPSQASPRMPMIAVMPDWQVLHRGTSATGALVTVRIIAATAIMTMAMEIGMERTSGFSAPGTVRSSG
jgi:putative transport protein